MGQYSFTQQELHTLIEKTIDSVFTALALQGVTIDMTGVVSIQVEITHGSEEITFDFNLLHKIAIVPDVEKENKEMGFSICYTNDY